MDKADCCIRTQTVCVSMDKADCCIRTQTVCVSMDNGDCCIWTPVKLGRIQSYHSSERKWVNSLLLCDK